MKGTDSNRRNALYLTMAFSLLVLGLAAAQPTVAQEVPGCDVIGESELEVNGASSAPIEPIKGKEVLTVEYEYRASETAWSINPVAIEFDTHNVPPWANTVLSDKIHFIEVDTPGPTVVTGSVDVTVMVSADAPAYERAAFEITAQAEEGTCVAPAETSADLDMTPGFFERWSAKAVDSILRTSQGETLPLEISVQNDGNGAIELQFEAADPNDELDLPRGIQKVGSEKQGAENQTTFIVEYEPTETGRKMVTVSISGRSADDNSINLEPESVSFSIQTEYSLAGLPALPIFFVLVPLLVFIQRIRTNHR